MKQGRSLIQLATELERQLATKLDMVVPTQLMHHETADGVSSLTVETPEGARTFAVTENCRRQLADRLGIPYKYFDRMRDSQPALLDRNVNTWLHEEPEQRMLRTLDGKARAFLSNRYQRRDNYALMVKILPELKKIPDAQFVSTELTESRMYLKVLAPRVRYEIAPGDVVEAGVVVTNSETGHGMTSVYPLVHRLRCRNGLIAADASMRRAHVGRRIDSSEGEVTIFKDDTLKADDDAFFLAMRDLVTAAVSESTFILIAERMRKTRGIRLVGDPMKSVEKLATRYLLNDAVRVGLLRELVSEGDLTGYGLVNAVTHFAQDPALGYEESTELEFIAGRMLDQTSKEWAELAEAT